MLKALPSNSNRLLKIALLFIFTLAIVSACGKSHSNFSDEISLRSNCRRIQHYMGESCIPVNPQRVAILDADISLDTALALGVKPIGTTRHESSYLNAKLNKVPSLGKPQTPSLEAIVALKPDLILGFSWYHKNIYDQLAQIAPTVITNYEHGSDTKKIITLVGSALGKEAATQQLIANYFARLAEFKSKMGSRLQNYQVSVVRIQENNFGLLQRGSYSGVILEDAGLSRPASQQYSEVHKAGRVWRHIQINISNERIPDLDADALFIVASEDTDSQQRVETLKANPLWSKLNVVQQGKVYQVSDYWLVGGPIALNLVIDDLFKYLVSSENETASLAQN